MFRYYVLSFFKKGDTIQGGTLFKEIWYVAISEEVLQHGISPSIKIMDFLRSHFKKMHYRYPFVMTKVFIWSEVHLSEVTSYKIHTLV